MHARIPDQPWIYGVSIRRAQLQQKAEAAARRAASLEGANAKLARQLEEQRAELEERAQGAETDAGQVRWLWLTLAG